MCAWRIVMKKILFLAVVALSFFGLDAQAGLFKKKVRCTGSCSGVCAKVCCSSCKSSAGADVKVEAAPQKKVEAPSPVQAQDGMVGGGRGQAPAPAKAQGKKVAAPQQ